MRRDEDRRTTGAGTTGAAGPTLARILPRALLLGAALATAACRGASPPVVGPSPGEEAGEPREAPEEVARDSATDAAVERERSRRDRDLEEGRLPEIPAETGPLRLEVRYPSTRQRLTARDSNFVFGSLGTGDARLWIDGTPVPVEPNGAFLAWLPVPPARGDTATYTLVARGGRSVDTLRLPVLLPPLPFAAPRGVAAVDSSFLLDPLPRWALPGEPVELAVRGAPGLAVWVEAGSLHVPLHPAPEGGPAPGMGAAEHGSALYRGAVSAGALREAACGEPTAACGGPEAREVVAGRGAAADRRAAGRRAPGALADARAEAGAEIGDGSGAGTSEDSLPAWPLDTLPVRLVAAAEDDTARLARRLPLGVLDPASLPAIRLVDEPSPVHGRRGVVVGRPSPNGPYRWRFTPGAHVRADGRVGDRLRIRLGPDLHAWISTEDAEPLPPGAALPPASVGGVRASPGADRVDVRLGLDLPVPAEVDEPDARTLHLTLFGARGTTDRVAYGGGDDLVESLRWEQLPGERYRLEVRTTAPLWGWELAYEAGAADAYEGPPAPLGGEGAGEGTVLRLSLHRPPAVDPEDPLRGRRIAVDPGHPPAGAHGPTGLYEGDANLAIARRLAELLEEEDARPILLRRDTLPLGLYERTNAAVAAGAELFVSIHNNALPDGVRPFGREGTSTYYYHPHSRALARAVQEGMVREMGLRDLGVLWGDLAVARTSWMPSVLAEGAFMMIPRHEAALRTDEFRERYARGVLRGIRAFLEARATGDGDEGDGDGAG